MTIGDEPEEPDPADAETGDPFTSASFASALSAVQAEAGLGPQADAPVHQPRADPVHRASTATAIEAFSVRADDPGEVVREEATITISGNATIDDFAFALDAVEPSAIDRMLASAKKQSGAGDFEPTVLSLERRIPFGDRALEWTINAEGGGRNLLYRAEPDGSEVRDSGGGGNAEPRNPRGPQQRRRGPGARRVHREGGAGHREGVRLPRAGPLGPRPRSAPRPASRSPSRRPARPSSAA